MCALVLSLACFAFLMWSSGHKEGVEGIVLTWQEKIYFDLYLIGAGVLFFILIFPLMEFLYGWGYASQESYENQVSAIVVSLCVTAMTALAVLVLRTLVVRCKAGVLAALPWFAGHAAGYGAVCWMPSAPSP